jgi:hypothetical protein
MSMGNGTIRHMAVFTLKHSKDAPETARFLEDGYRILTGIPVVKNFEVLRQINPKTDFDFGFCMEFDSQDDYTAYNEHPDHVAFVQERWLKEVARFQEIDFVKA